MALIGMSEAAKRAGYSTSALRRLLQADGVPLVTITPRAFAVEGSDLEAFIARRGANPGPGRPRKIKNEEAAGS